MANKLKIEFFGLGAMDFGMASGFSVLFDKEKGASLRLPKDGVILLC